MLIMQLVISVMVNHIGTSVPDKFAQPNLTTYYSHAVDCTTKFAGDDKYFSSLIICEIQSCRFAAFHVNVLMLIFISCAIATLRQLKLRIGFSAKAVNCAFVYSC